MKKADFLGLVLGVIGGVMFALGMCMCLLPEWNAFTPGLILGAAGLILLLAMLLIRRRMQGKPLPKCSKKNIGIAALSIGGSLVLGVGMCLCMVWSHIIWGVIVGLIGILMLLCLIPLSMGLK